MELRDKVQTTNRKQFKFDCSIVFCCYLLESFTIYITITPFHDIFIWDFELFF
jgi:hypothetical protein